MTLLNQAQPDPDVTAHLRLDEESLPGGLRHPPPSHQVRGLVRGAFADDVRDIGPVEAEQGCPHLLGGDRCDTVGGISGSGQLVEESHRVNL
ncbi:hypothetical protein SALBM311S_04495 [Streptomyces alboniger]